MLDLEEQQKAPQGIPVGNLGLHAAAAGPFWGTSRGARFEFAARRDLQHSEGSRGCGSNEGEESQCLGRKAQGTPSGPEWGEVGWGAGAGTF